MKQIAIIGAGQLGSRHLQGLSKLALDCEITVIDPMQASLAVAKQRFEEMPANGCIHAVRYGTSISDIPSAVDYVIVATTADVRMDVLRALLAGHTVKYLLLEKVLFQNLDEYAQAEALLTQHGVKAWVNCPRRVYSIYNEVRSFLGNDTIHALSVSGGNWGLGCNSIHFLDLFGVLTGASPVAVSTRDLDEQLIESKRKNFVEFTGTLRGEFGSAKFELTSIAGSAAKLLIVIRSESRSCIIDEGAGAALFLDGANWTRREFRAPMLSELATSVATDILQEGQCGLATYEQSKAYHLPLLGALSEVAATRNGTPAGFCPVT
jgi:predicted dehydrogenase